MEDKDSPKGKKPDQQQEPILPVGQESEDTEGNVSPLDFDTTRGVETEITEILRGGLLSDNSPADQVAEAPDIEMSPILNAYTVGERQPSTGQWQIISHAVPVDINDQRVSDQRRMTRILLSLVCLFIVILTVSLSLTRAVRNNEENQSVGDLGTTTSPSPVALTLQPTTERFSDICDEIRSHFESPTLEQDLTNPESPQYRAVLWMAQEDEHPTTAKLSYPLNQTSLDVLEFRQRYALATLYYSTGDEKWKDRCNFLTPSLHVCDWRCSWNATDTIVAAHFGLSWLSTSYMGVNCGRHYDESNHALDDLVISLEIGKSERSNFMQLTQS